MGQIDISVRFSQAFVGLGGFFLAMVMVFFMSKSCHYTSMGNE